MDEEVENIEYLEDCVTDEVAEVNDGYVPLPHNTTAVDPTFEDAFYPNAVQCLIALYRDKYEKQMSSPQEICKAYKDIWEHISNDMKESFFDFDARQVKQKFTQLRQQYFDVTTKTDFERFEYFQPFHEIYNDKYISTLLNNHSTNDNKIKHTNIRPSYRDDVLFGPLPKQELHTDVADKQKQTEEIAHKEQELMIMMERELKAIDGDSCNKDQVKLAIPTIKRERQEAIEVQNPTSLLPKRTKFEKVTPLHTHKEEVELQTEKALPELSHGNEGDMTLAAYNEAQQRRHDEKMDLLRQTLSMHERMMELQIKLMEHIVKRVK